MKPPLTLHLLQSEAHEFSKQESLHDEAALYGVTDGDPAQGSDTVVPDDVPMMPGYVTPASTPKPDSIAEVIAPNTAFPFPMVNFTMSNGTLTVF